MKVESGIGLISGGTAIVKIFIGFMSGFIVCGLFLLGTRLVIPTRAETNSTENLTDNASSLSALVPDIESIYHEALLMPFEKAKDKIYDPDIAAYYSELLERAGLTREATGTP
jgi:hypothetical protein